MSASKEEMQALVHRYGKKLDRNIEKLSIGIGTGITTQMQGLYDIGADPVGFAKAFLAFGKQFLADPKNVAGAIISDTVKRATSGPMGFGEVVGENLSPSWFRKARARYDMTVYHGSPHDFDKFDMSKIGTGEGAQAYGHGLYVAESPGVAKSYAAKLADLNNPRDVINSFILNRTPNGSIAGLREAMTQHELLRPIFEQNPSLLDDALTLARGYEAASNTYTDAAIKAANRLDTKLPTPKGKFYHVDLADEHIAKMLDWNAPLSEQPEAIHEIVRDMLKQQGYLRPNDNGPRQLQTAFKAWKIERAGMAESGKGESIYGLLSKQLGSDEAASNYLRERGIPGIKYWDAGSREAGRGTRNYVVFDDKLLKILKRE